MSSYELIRQEICIQRILKKLLYNTEGHSISLCHNMKSTKILISGKCLLVPKFEAHASFRP